MSDARIFVSYSHRGRGPEWKAALLRVLHVFDRHHLLDVWQDGKIRVSAFWDDDIKEAMEQARAAVVLLTPEALQSPFILETEFPFLRERQQNDRLPVFPVICEPCDWRSHDWLRATQAPNDSQPLSELAAARRDHLFRGLATDIAENLGRLTLSALSAANPPPDEHLYLEKFPLTRAGLREEMLIGREQELALLDLALGQPHTAIVSLVAWGGVGKTMLVQNWLRHLQRDGWYGAGRVYAWSFYSQGTKEDRQASEDTFLAHALAWFGVECEPTLSPWDKGRLLAETVVRERTLLVLDGIEPLQYPPGPMGGQLRAPGVQSLLKHLARRAKATNHGGLCLVTTREPLADLADFERVPGTVWGTALRVDLSNLTDETGAALLHHAGASRAGAADIKADDPELLAASREVDGHALTLNLLGRFLTRAHNGDIRRRDLITFDEADRKEQGGTTFKMLAAFESWFANSGDFGARQLAVLRMLGLFDRPADAGCVASMRKPPAIAGLTDALFTTRLNASTRETTIQPLLEEDWNTATSFLADFGLVVIQVDAQEDGRHFDCHPLIREYFARQLCVSYPKAWREGNLRLFVHLAAAAKEHPDTIDEMQPLYQAVGHGCQAGREQAALDEVYWRRIQRGKAAFDVDTLGAIGADLATVANFFYQPWGAPVSSLTDKDQTFVIGQAAFRLTALGRLEEALEPSRLLAQQRAEQAQRESREKTWNNACYAAGNLSNLHLLLGDIQSAREVADQAVRLAEMGAAHWQREMILAARAAVFHHAGQSAAALEDFITAEGITKRHGFGILSSIQGLRYCDFLLDQGQTAEAVWRAQAVIMQGMAAGWPLDVGLGHLILAQANLRRSGQVHDLPRAMDDCEAAMRALRRAGMQDEISRCMLTRSWLRSLGGNLDGARADLDDAWDIAERGPMRLHLADIHLRRAWLFFREKPYPWKSAQEDLAAAEKLISECGYHRRDEELSEAKLTTLES